MGDDTVYSMVGVFFLHNNVIIKNLFFFNIQV